MSATMPGHRRAALVVRVHDHRDPDGPLGAVEEEQGDRLPTEIGVAEDDGDGVADLAYVSLHRRGSSDEYLVFAGADAGRVVRNTEPMAADRDAQLLALVRELERQDVDLAARIDTVSGLLGRVDAVRAAAAASRGPRGAPRGGCRSRAERA